MLCRPCALLLDYGGVIVDAPVLPPAPLELVRRVHQLVDGAVPTGQIAHDLVEGARRYARWRDQVSRDDRPAELSHVQVWDSFVTPNWPDPARAKLRREATALCYAWTLRPDWAVRPGVRELLDTLSIVGLPAAIVSNTLCGAAHRDFLAGVGLTDRFAVQLYSDEVGVRKPNPEIAWQAARELDVRIEDCWFVGDSLARDIGCARRAGVGGAVLMRSPRTDREAPIAHLAPDATVDDGHGLSLVLADFLG